MPVFYLSAASYLFLYKQILWNTSKLLQECHFDFPLIAWVKKQRGIWVFPHTSFSNTDTKTVSRCVWFLQTYALPQVANKTEECLCSCSQMARLLLYRTNAPKPNNAQLYSDLRQKGGKKQQIFTFQMLEWIKVCHFCSKKLSWVINSGKLIINK